MNIGFYRYSLYNRGGDRIVVEYANYLANLGHNVVFYTSEVNTVFAIDSKVAIEKISCRGRAGFLLYGVLHKLKSDIVIIDIIHLLLLVSLRNKVVYLAQANDREYYANPLLRIGIDVLYRISLRRSRCVIADSEYLAETLSKRYKCNNLYTAAIGIDLMTFHHDPDNTLEVLKEHRRAIIFMQRGDYYRKGHDVAIEVFKLIDEELRNKTELWILGEPLVQEKFRVIVRNFGVVSDARLRQILSSGDIFFYPSRHEGFGLFPLEAMACGCAVVATDAIPYARSIDAILTSSIGDVPNLFKDIKRLVLDPAELHALRMKAMTVAKNYDHEKTKKKFEHILNITS